MNTTWYAAALPVLLTVLTPLGERTALAGSPARHRRFASEPSVLQGTSALASSPTTYFIQREDGLRAPNPSQGFLAEFTRSGVHLGARDGGLRFSLTTARYGCAGDLREVTRAEPGASKNEVVYDHAGAGLVEWYVNRPSGLEQGFTLPSAPPCRAGRGELVIEMLLAGDLSATLAGGGLSVDLRDPSGAVALRYADLWVRDATERALPAHLDVDGRRLSIHLDDTGAIYPLTVDPTLQVDETRLIDDDGSPADEFGCSVAIDGDTAVVGECLDDEMADNAGSAHVFTRDDQGKWSEVAKLLADDPLADDEFGISVAVSGNTVLVGTNRTKSPPSRAYVFVRKGSEWQLEAHLASSKSIPWDRFGNSVALEGDTALIGAQGYDGAAYIFERNKYQWTETQQLLPTDMPTDKHFGWSVALSRKVAVVGAVGKGENAGSAYVFERGTSAWTQSDKLSLTDPSATDKFGLTVAISGTRILVGAYGTASFKGSAHLFEKDGALWSTKPPMTLLGSDSKPEDNFGFWVALDGDTAVIGAPGATQKNGSVYVFKKDESDWLEVGQVKPTVPVTGGRLGLSVAVSGDTVLAGAPGDINIPGSAYAFSLHFMGDACSEAKECLNGFCVDGVCCDKPCDDLCMACSKEKKEYGEDGFCEPIEGIDPDGECSEEGTPTCKLNVCSAGDCKLKNVDDIPCGEGATCVAGECILPETPPVTGTGDPPPPASGCTCGVGRSPLGGAFWLSLGALLVLRRRVARLSARAS